MEDETLNNILNLLQNATNNNNSNNTNNSAPSNNNDIQSLLIKFLLSGGLNQIMNLRNQNTTPPPTPAQSQPEKPRTIDLTNYQRLDWTTTASSTMSIAAKWICCVMICSEILSSICVWIKRRIGRTP